MLMTFLFQCCSISLVITSALATGTIARVKRCPTRAERSKMHPHPKCKSPEVYHCLIDDEDKFVETCNEFIQLPPGNYPRYTSFSERVYYDPCPHSRYQPWPIKSYEITECEVVKSLCTGIGQVQCSGGSITNDATCSCDYKNGYVMTGPDKCCSPAGNDDCFCKYHSCQSDLQELDSDYNCVDKCNPGYYRPLGRNSCEDIQNSSYTSDTKTTTYNVTATSSFSLPGTYYQENLGKNGVEIAIGIGFALCLIILLVIVFFGDVWRPYKYKLVPLLALCAVLLISFAIVIILVVLDEYAVAAQIGVTLLVIAVVLGTAHVVFIFSTHNWVKDRLTYDEDYEVQIYTLLKAASEGDIKILKSLANQRYIDMYDTDYDKRSALHLAACQGHYKAVEYLLNNNIGYPKAKDWCLGRTAAQDAKWHMELKENKARRTEFDNIITLLEVNKGVKKIKHHFRDIVAMKLIKAAENGDTTDLESLRDLGTDMNLSDSDGRTALHAAVERKQDSVIDFLINKCKVSPFVRWRDKQPLQLIKDGQDNQKLKEKLRDYMDNQINSKSDLHKKTPDDDEDEDVKIVRILNSASRGDIRLIKAYDASQLTLSNYDKRTALHIAVSNNQEHVVEYLLKDCGLTEEVQKAEDRWKRTPLMVAKEKGRSKIFKMFLKYCPNVTNTENDEYKTFSLLMAGKNGDVDTLRRLFDSGVSMNMQDYDGRTALHLAVDEWKEDAMEYLIYTCNCNRNIQDRYGHTAEDTLTKDTKRLEQFEERHKEKNEHITEEKESCNENEIMEDLENEKGKPRMTIMNRQISRTKSRPPKHFTPKIKQQVAPPQVTDRSNLYLLFEAAAIGDVETIKKSDYPYFDVGDYIKNTPLHIAAAAGHLNVVKYLVEDCNVSPFIRDNGMKRPVDVVVEQVRLLSSCKATEENMKQRALITGVRNFFINKMENIRKSTEKVNDPVFTKYENDVQTFMLLNRTYKGDIRSVRGYVDSDISILNRTDYDGRTALHIAVAENHDHLVKFFLEELKESIKTDIEDRWNNTALNDAEENLYYDILMIFKDNDYKVDDMYLLAAKKQHDTNKQVIDILDS